MIDQRLSTPAVTVEHFPDGRIVPPFLTPAETVELLRLDVVSQRDGSTRKRELADAVKTLDRLCRRGVLTGIRLGKSRVYARDQVLAIARGSAGGGGELPCEG